MARHALRGASSAFRVHLRRCIGATWRLQLSTSILPGAASSCSPSTPTSPTASPRPRVRGTPVGAKGRPWRGDTSASGLERWRVSQRWSGQPQRGSVLGKAPKNVEPRAPTLQTSKRTYFPERGHLLHDCYNNERDGRCQLWLLASCDGKALGRARYAVSGQFCAQLMAFAARLNRPVQRMPERRTKLRVLPP